MFNSKWHDQLMIYFLTMEYFYEIPSSQNMFRISSQKVGWLGLIVFYYVYAILYIFVCMHDESNGAVACGVAWGTWFHLHLPRE